MTSTRHRIVVVSNRLETLRQVHSDGGEAAMRVAAGVSANLSLAPPVPATAQALSNWTNDDWGRVACLVFPSNSLRHEDSALHPLMDSLREIVHTHSQHGMGLVMLHHFLSNMPLVYPEIDGGLPLRDHLVDPGQHITFLPDIANTAPFLLPRLKAIDQAREVISWKALSHDPERLTPLAVTQDGLSVIARSTGDVRIVVSTIPLDWWNEDQVLANVMTWGARGAIGLSSFGSIGEAAGAFAPRWNVTEESLKAWRADFFASTQRALSPTLPQSVISFKEDMNSEVLQILRNSNVTCMLFERSGDRFEVIAPEPAQRLAEQHQQDLIASRHEVLQLVQRPSNSLFGLRNILLANHLLEQHLGSLEQLVAELLTEQRISSLRGNLCFDGMTFSSLLVATQIEALTRPRARLDDGLRAELDQRMSAAPATDEHTVWLKDISLALLRDQSMREEPPAPFHSSNAAANLRVADTSAFVSYLGREIRLNDFEPVVNSFGYVDNADDAEALAATCRLKVARRQRVPSHLVNELERFAQTGPSLGARAASRAALALVYQQQPPIVVPSLLAPTPAHSAPQSALTDLNRINALEVDLTETTKALHRTRRATTVGTIASHLLAAGLIAASVYLVVAWSRSGPLGPSLITPILLLMVSVYLALGFLGWMNVLSPRVEALRVQFQRAIRRRLFGD